MTLDPKEAVEAARASGDPQVAEWMQREADAYTREKRNGRLTVAACAIVPWLVIAALLLWWGAR